MKAILTIIFFLFIGFIAKAQDKPALVVKACEVKSTVLIKQRLIKSTDVKTVRLYKTKNHEVLKALSFEATYNKIKLA
ncbi:hypothetical protein KO500_08960 [Cellulophaga baltica]|uniref:hypothetical protein n=1 Tax=Cellulophaga TaxID=104264 RepID=UPI001C074782|nr:MULTISPECIES: hypothetical protein [Cellulophaga]MBU2996564.1 hypothetical protein [Cellulophaga baltica]MDO6767958.1 hypothetical protein [Cellulophaga sp. 1_MG-2023]